MTNNPNLVTVKLIFFFFFFAEQTFFWNCDVLNIALSMVTTKENVSLSVFSDFAHGTPSVNHSKTARPDRSNFIVGLLCRLGSIMAL